MKKARWICAGVSIAILGWSLTVLFLVLFGGRISAQNHYDKKVIAFARENRTAEVGQIVFIGDSITEGYANINAYYKLPLKIYNRGISGDTVQGVENRLKVSVFDIAPSKIVLNIGVNNIGMGEDVGTITARYAQLVDAIKVGAPDAQLFIVSVYPMNHNLWGGDETAVDAANRKVVQLNTNLRGICVERGLSYIDVYARLVQPDGTSRPEHMPDGIHPVAAGYAIITSVIKPYIR